MLKQVFATPGIENATVSCSHNEATMEFDFKLDANSNVKLLEDQITVGSCTKDDVMLSKNGTRYTIQFNQKDCDHLDSHYVINPVELKLPHGYTSTDNNLTMITGQVNIQSVCELTNKYKLRYDLGSIQVDHHNTSLSDDNQIMFDLEVYTDAARTKKFSSGQSTKSGTMLYAKIHDDNIAAAHGKVWTLSDCSIISVECTGNNCVDKTSLALFNYTDSKCTNSMKALKLKTGRDSFEFSTFKFSNKPGNNVFYKQALECNIVVCDYDNKNSICQKINDDCSYGILPPIERFDPSWNATVIKNEKVMSGYVAWNTEFNDTHAFVPGDDGNGKIKAYNLISGDLDQVYDTGLSNVYSVAVLDNTVFAACYSNSKIVVFNGDGTIIQSSSTSSYPHAIAVENDRAIYVGTSSYYQRHYSLKRNSNNNTLIGNYIVSGGSTYRYSYAVTYDDTYVYQATRSGSSYYIMMIRKSDNVHMYNVGGHSSYIYELRVHGNYLISGSADNTIKVWKTATRALIGTVNLGNDVRGFDIDDGGHIFVSVYGRYKIAVYKFHDDKAPTFVKYLPHTYNSYDCRAVRYNQRYKQLYVGCWNGQLTVTKFD